MLNYASIPAEELLNALYADEADAWVYVWMEAVKIVRQSRKLTEITKKKSSQPEEIANRVYASLRKNDFETLRSYRADGPFVNWLHSVVRSSVNTLNETEYERDHVAVCDPHDPGGAIAKTEDVGYMVEIRQEREDLRARLVDSRPLMVQLWAKEPDWFWALFLKYEAGLSSRTIGAALGTTEGNVNAMTYKARNEMRKMEKLAK